MNIHALFSTAVTDRRWQVLILGLLFLAGCKNQYPADSARSGTMVVAADRQLAEIVNIESDMFRRYYPDARIGALPSSPRLTLSHLLDRSARAALISGNLDAAEDSLFGGAEKKMRMEPVALDAIVCITGQKNRLRTLSVNELQALFYGREDGRDPFMLRDDFRLLSVFSRIAGRKNSDIRAWSCSDINELIRRVSSSDHAYGLVFASSLETARNAGVKLDSVKILAVSQNRNDDRPCIPDRDAVFEDRYPLVATVYYVYYPGDALAAGFGAWISSSGQKALERSSFVPYRLTRRMIILK